MTPPVLELRDISFAYPGRESESGSDVLRGIGFTLAQGAATALLGANGAGKTTLLRIAAGALQPASGQVLLEGKPTGTYSRRELGCRVALVPQRMEMAFAFTVRQIVEQGRTPYLGALRGPGRADRLAVDRAMDLADVTGLAERVFHELSGGERQRVRIALGLAQQPRLLILDEPTQNLDIGRAAELMNLLGVLQSEGITILASMHDLHLVRGRFDHVLLLGPQSRMVEGTPDEVMTTERLEWAFDCPPGRGMVALEGLVPSAIQKA